MENQEYIANAKALDFVTDVNDMVATHVAAIGGLGKGFANLQLIKIIQTKKLERPLGFITIGEPVGATKQVIEAFRKEAMKQ